MQTWAAPAAVRVEVHSSPFQSQTPANARCRGSKNHLGVQHLGFIGFRAGKPPEQAQKQAKAGNVKSFGKPVP